VIEPGVLHHVELLDAETTFLIEFHRKAGAASTGSRESTHGA
jgi:hypothetical protein